MVTRLTFAFTNKIVWFASQTTTQLFKNEQYWFVYKRTVSVVDVSLSTSVELLPNHMLTIFYDCNFQIYRWSVKSGVRYCWRHSWPGNNQGMYKYYTNIIYKSFRHCHKKVVHYRICFYTRQSTLLVSSAVCHRRQHPMAVDRASCVHIICLLPLARTHRCWWWACGGDGVYAVAHQCITPLSWDRLNGGLC